MKGDQGENYGKIIRAHIFWGELSNISYNKHKQAQLGGPHLEMQVELD